MGINAAISEEAATKVAQSIIDSQPYIPVKGKAPASITYSTTPVKVTTDKIENATLNLSSIGFGSNVSFINGEAQAGQSKLVLGAFGLSPNDTFAIVRIALETNTPPWDIYIAVIRMNQNGPEVLRLFTPKKEINQDLVKDGRNTNAHFNADWVISDDSAFSIRYYDTSTQSEPNNPNKHDIEYTYNYEIEGNQAVKK
jgi:hypothetical protein